MVLDPKVTVVPQWQYFSKPLGGGPVAVLLMNHGTEPLNLTLTFTDVFEPQFRFRCSWTSMAAFCFGLRNP